MPNLNLITDPITEPITDQLNDFELLLLKTIRDNPGLNVPKLLFKINDAKITKDMIKNSLKRKLSSYVTFRGSRSNGGYFINECKKSVKNGDE